MIRQIILFLNNKKTIFFNIITNISTSLKKKAVFTWHYPKNIRWNHVQSNSGSGRTEVGKRPMWPEQEKYFSQEKFDLPRLKALYKCVEDEIDLHNSKDPSNIKQKNGDDFEPFAAILVFLDDSNTHEKKKSSPQEKIDTKWFLENLRRLNKLLEGIKRESFCLRQHIFHKVTYKPLRQNYINVDGIRYFLGRLYADKEYSYTYLPKEIRGFLIRDEYRHFGLVNSRPAILFHHAKKFIGEEHVPVLRRYVLEREAVLEEKASVDGTTLREAKRDILTIINSTRLNTSSTGHLSKALFEEIQLIRNHLFEQMEDGIEGELKNDTDYKGKSEEQKKIVIQNLILDTREKRYLTRLMDFIVQNILVYYRNLDASKSFKTDLFVKYIKSSNADYYFRFIPFFDGLFVGSEDPLVYARFGEYVDKFNRILEEEGDYVKFEEKPIRYGFSHLNASKLNFYLKVEHFLILLSTREFNELLILLDITTLEFESDELREMILRAKIFRREIYRKIELEVKGDLVLNNQFLLQLRRKYRERLEVSTRSQRVLGTDLNYDLEDTQKEDFETTSLKLSASEDEYIFTKGFLDSLGTTLGKPEHFNAANKKEQQAISDKLQALLLTETNQGVGVSKVKRGEASILKLFPKESEIFRSLFGKHFFSPLALKDRHKLKKYGSEKSLLFFSNFLKFFYNKDKVVSEKVPKLDLSKINFRGLLEKIKADFIFEGLVRIAMEEVYEQRKNIIDSSKKSDYGSGLDKKFLFVKVTSLMYITQESLFIYLANIAIEAFEITHAEGRLWDSPEQRVDYIHNFYKKHKRDFAGLDTREVPWYKNTFDIVRICIDIFRECGIVTGSELVTQAERKHAYEILLLNIKVRDALPFSHYFPRIIPPTKIQEDINEEVFVKPFVKGESNVTISKSARDALNIAQEKKLTVDPYTLKFMARIHNIEKYVGKTPYPKKSELVNKLNELAELGESTSVCSLQIHIYKKALTFLSLAREKGKDGNKKVIYKAFKVANISTAEQDINRKKKKLTREFIVLRAKRQLLQTSLAIAYKYIGFPLYYGTKLDYRTRNYPREYLLSRTTGHLKHLVMEFVETKLTVEGIIRMMEALYRFSEVLIVEFTIFINDLTFVTALETEKFKLLQEFYHKNRTRCEKESDFDDQIVYGEAIKATLNDCFDKGKLTTGRMIEIDQKASGLTLLAMIFGLSSLAKVTNLKGGKPRDIYLEVISVLPAFFEKATYKDPSTGKTVSYERGNLIKFLTNDRSVIKGVLMRWSYGEGAYSRGTAFVRIFKESGQGACSDAEFLTLMAFGRDFDRFLEEIFPGLKERKEILLKVLSIRINATNARDSSAVNIKTIDDCDLAWDFIPTKSVPKMYYNPVTCKHQLYKINQELDGAKAISIRKAKHLRAFFPNFIHSLDGAIMRILIQSIYKATGYRIGHIHDAIQVHPNYVNDVYAAIENLYTDTDWVGLLRKMFFDPMKEGMTAEVIEEINKLESEFYELVGEFRVEKGVFNPRHAYVMKGNVSEEKVWEARSSITNTKAS